MNNIFDDTTHHFFMAILSLKNEEECEKFFSDVCTVKEIREIAQRYEVVKMLTAGCVYNDIAKKTGASTATISRVSRALQFGEGGYKIAMDRETETHE